jgi:hypothetical protein
MAEETAIEPAVGTSAVVTIPTISVRRQLPRMVQRRSRGQRGIAQGWSSGPRGGLLHDCYNIATQATKSCQFKPARWPDSYSERSAPGRNRTCCLAVRSRSLGFPTHPRWPRLIP